LKLYNIIDPLVRYTHQTITLESQNHDKPYSNYCQWKISWSLYWNRINVCCVWQKI